jgi:S-DNA-T family DNA segregation ATPase FtsK/SpoIIIE
VPKSVSKNTRSTSARANSRRSASAKSKPAAGRRTTHTASRSAPAPRWSWQSLSPERKLDVAGVALAIAGLLTLLSLLSGQHGILTQWWVDTLYQLTGWGAFVLPLGLIGIGLWLVFRNVEKLPTLSAERLLGILLIYLNLLTWLSQLRGEHWEVDSANLGGGTLGTFFAHTLTTWIGPLGAVILLFSWLLVGLAFTLDLSIPELFQLLQPLYQRLRRRIQQATAPASTPAANNAVPARPGTPAAAQPQGSSATPLPADFKPLGGTPGRAAAAPSLFSRPAAASTPPQAQATPPAGGNGPALAAAPDAPAQPALPAPPWVLPAVEQILDPATPVSVQANVDQERGQLIEETLASFGAPAHIVEVHRGPTVTQFGVEPEFIETRSGRTRVRVSKIANLADDLALALAAPRIRIQAPVPGRSYVGIEVPNTEISRVSLREVLESDPFTKSRSCLRLALGKDVAGKPTIGDLSALPHLLIAGTTGSGKSVCVNSILCSLLLYNTPADLRLMLVDPKRVELTGYNGIPHLLAPVVVEAERVVAALQWILLQMDSRYHRFSQVGVRNIQEFNTRMPAEKLPYLVVIVDELADLMMLAPDETERSITRLAQLARATGIHLILATQRPSVDVVTGLIKANFPARIAFAVASGVDSRVILDQPGAERLLGRGDMLYHAPDAPAPVRLQGVYVGDSEIQRLVDYWRTAAAELATAQPPDSLAGSTQEAAPSFDAPSGPPLKQVPLWDGMAVDEGDPLMGEAVELVRREGRASITMLQRRMRIGYTRAARLIDAMEDKGIVSPSLPNSQVREVLDYGQGAQPVDES